MVACVNVTNSLREVKPGHITRLDTSEEFSPKIVYILEKKLNETCNSEYIKIKYFQNSCKIVVSFNCITGAFPYQYALT